MVDRWNTLNVQCNGGLIENLDSLDQGTNLPGSAVQLTNYEPALEGGYSRILGYAKYSTTEITGTGAILGVAVGIGGVVACRYDGATDYALYYGTGSSWAKINGTSRTNLVTKMRGVRSSILVESLILCDGANFAAKWDGTIYTLINGSGAPADPKFAATFKNRLVLAGYSADTSEISISEPNSDIGFVGANGAVSIPVSDVIVGIKTFRDALYIYCKNSIKKLTGNTTSDFIVTDVTQDIGCLSGDTIQELGGDLLFLSPDGIRSTAATERVDDIELGLVSRQIQPTIRNKIGTGLDESRYSSLLVRGKSQYRLMLNEPGVTRQNQLGIIGKLNQGRNTNGQVQLEWANTLAIQPYCADSAYVGNQEVAVIGDTASGFVFRLEQGNSFNDANIPYVFVTPDITFQAPTQRKVLQKIEVYMQLAGAVDVQLRTILDRGVEGVPQPSTQQLVNSTGSSSFYGTAIYGTGTYSVFAFPIIKKNLVGGAFVAAFAFSGNDISPPHRIDAFSVVFAQKAYR
jgi:hypothetical protein